MLPDCSNIPANAAVSLPFTLRQLTFPSPLGFVERVGRRILAELIRPKTMALKCWPHTKPIRLLATIK
jgi:hypothetical protein